MIEYLTSLLLDPNAWIALGALITMEVVLGIDNLIFISVLTNKLPADKRHAARRIGIGAALVLRLLLLGAIATVIRLREPVFEVFRLGFSWRDLILIAGGLFLVWKATKEIHHSVDSDPAPDLFDTSKTSMGVAAAVGQILLLDLVFSVDSIVTAVGMTDHVPIMVIAVIVAVLVMLLAATPLANFIHRNPTIVMLALAFLLMIGTTLIADGFGVHVPRGYIYAAMAFSALVEGLNIISRRARSRRARRSGGGDH
jgi:predicted tellurium resistance membrane protein TerC